MTLRRLVVASRFLVAVVLACVFTVSYSGWVPAVFLGLSLLLSLGVARLASELSADPPPVAVFRLSEVGPNGEEFACTRGKRLSDVAAFLGPPVDEWDDETDRYLEYRFPEVVLSFTGETCLRGSDRLKDVELQFRKA